MEKKPHWRRRRSPRNVRGPWTCWSALFTKTSHLTCTRYPTHSDHLHGTETWTSVSFAHPSCLTSRYGCCWVVCCCIWLQPSYCTTPTGNHCNADFPSRAPSPHIPFFLWVSPPHCFNHYCTYTTQFKLCFTPVAPLRPFFFVCFSFPVCACYHILCVPPLGSFFSAEHAKPAVLQRRAAWISKVCT